MATCPRCKEGMNSMAAFCPHCGYDFPLQAKPKDKRGIAYSALGDMALVVGMLATGIGAIGSLVRAGAALIDKNDEAVFVSTIQFFILLAAFVVFQRVADMD